MADLEKYVGALCRNYVDGAMGPTEKYPVMPLYIDVAAQLRTNAVVSSDVHGQVSIAAGPASIGIQGGESRQVTTDANSQFACRYVPREILSNASLLAMLPAAPSIGSFPPLSVTPLPETLTPPMPSSPPVPSAPTSPDVPVISPPMPDGGV